jgi:flavin reductase (DIM6/NTAB) family NADH-FMN oxidoreductase RutF
LSIDKTLFRQVAGSFATGVTVITTGLEGEFHGMTASAFTSLSLEPTQVLVCIDRTAHTLPVLQACGRFNVNILGEDQEDISRLFASKEAQQGHALDGVDYRLGELGVPLLKGTLGFLECRVVQQYDGGDHVIFVGEVENAALGEAERPLLYYRSRYRRIEADEQE